MARAKLTDEQRAEILKRRNGGESAKKLAKEFGVGLNLVYRTCNGTTNVNCETELNMSELRAKLMQFGYVFEELENKTRTELVNLLDEEVAGTKAAAAIDSVTETSDVITDNLTPMLDVVKKGDKQEQIEQKQSDNNNSEKNELENKKEYKIGDQNWPQFALSLFCDEELDGKNPRLDGLRRVAESVIGQIIEEGCDLIAPPSSANNDRACAKAWVVFSDKETGQFRRYESLADASPDNSNEEFAKYPTCLAHTRALARCFRSALHLRVIAAEETSNTSIITGVTMNDDQIQSAQKSVIMLMIDRLGLKLGDLLKELNIEKTNLNDLTRADGMTLSRKLNELQQIKYNADNKLDKTSKKEKKNGRKPDKEV